MTNFFVRKYILGLLVLGITSPALLIAKEKVPYKNSELSVEERVNDLLKRMTIEEKIAQMTMAPLDKYEQSEHGYGVAQAPFVGVEAIAEKSARVKKYALEKTRLGIPPIQSSECIHGFLAHGSTIFPQAIAQGSTWNPQLIKEMTSRIAFEASLAGLDQQLSPVVDVIRDPRYGRTEECFGEDPFHVSVIADAYVRGVQGEPEDTRVKMKKDKLICTAKHFAGYSAAQAGMNLAPSSLGEREMRSIFMPPFEKLVKESNLLSIMPSYNEVDGIPAHSSHFLLDQVLRKEWGFKGYVFADYGGVPMLSYYQGIAKDWKDAAELAVKAGVDLDAPSGDAYKFLKELLNEGRLTEKDIDKAVSRILTVKFRAGLFEKPYADVKKVKKYLHNKEAQELALKVAEESAILLKNENNILPLNVKNGDRIAVIGPNANQVQYGGYSYTKNNESGVTVYQGLKDKLKGKADVAYAKGCSISSLDRTGFDEAINLAKKSDYIVFVMGEGSPTLSGVGWGDDSADINSEPPTSGEGYDVTDIKPYGVQRELLQQIYSLGKPVVLVMVHGRPWAIDWEKDNIPAILESWYPGEKGGEAIANILTGQTNPSGRLAVTIPRSVGHIPVSYNYKPSSKGFYKNRGSVEKPGRDYVFSSPDPLFCFGHGLSFSDFKYSDLSVSSKTLSVNDTLIVSVNVENLSKVDGKEVIQVYVNDMLSSVATPVIELKGFAKELIKAGEKRKVNVKIPVSSLGLWNREMNYVVEPGDFNIMIGKSAEDILLNTIVKVK